MIQLWERGQKAHAAKQAVCHINRNDAKLDLNAQVDHAIRIGMLAGQMYNCSARAFIAAVETGC